VPKLIACAALLLALTACNGGTPTVSVPPASPSGSLPGSPSYPATASLTPSSAVTPSDVPPGVPASYPKDRPAAALPVASLVPPGATVTDNWVATTSAGDQVGVAYTLPGSDPLRLAHGLVVWRRFPGESPPWRPTLGLGAAPAHGVLDLQTLLGDVTGDGSDDALVFEATGGSGACGTYLVLDLAAATKVFSKTACDTQVDPHIDPVGLLVREAVFKTGDAHCCPSAIRETVLTYAGDGAWATASKTVTPTG
jgi:hypothetical protein